MLYSDFCGEKVSKLGIGAMRLPLLENGSIDEAQVNEMVAYAAEHGVNYFDTAYPYHNGMSEIVLGRALKQLPRENYFLADKYPGHQIAETYIPSEIFEEQLKKCDVEYFDYYMLHNIYEKSAETYMDPKWGIVDYFVEQKKLGRIKHLGFSTHAIMPCLERFLEAYGDQMEFCQIQMNYLDWDVRDGPEKYELLAKYNLDPIVMEPMRGGVLADLGEEANAQLKAAQPERSIASWAMRWQLSTPAKVILSGVSNMEQLKENIATYEEGKPLSAEENELLQKVSVALKDSVPCTACRYCCDSCSMELDIPALLKLANDARVAPSFTLGMVIDSFPEDKRPAACTHCRECEAMCPQNIAIPDVLAELVESMKDIPHWEDMCRERAEIARKMREQQALEG